MVGRGSGWWSRGDRRWRGVPVAHATGSGGQIKPALLGRGGARPQPGVAPAAPPCLDSRDGATIDKRPTARCQHLARPPSAHACGIYLLLINTSDSMNFAAIDVETANADVASICQIGVATYEGGKLIGEWKTYIDPEDEFDGTNISIHGINELTVAGAPIFSAIFPQLCGLMSGRVVVCHTHFDRLSLQKAALKYSLEHPACTWLDSARVTRRTWEQFARSGYGLKSVCDHLGYTFAHHDALEDAKAAAHILLSAATLTGMDLAGWLKRVEQPINPGGNQGNSAAREGNPEGPLYGEVLVFTGALKIPRQQAADMAAQVGCEVCDGVNKKTTVLVVGDQDIRRLAGAEKSNKHRKAETLILKGQAIRILTESDFRDLVTALQQG